MIGVLKIKLGKCHTAPTKRNRADLLEVARLCNLCRNAMARAWQRWHEDHADWLPPAKVNPETGEPKLYRDGTPIRENGHFPAKVDGEHGPIGLATWLYHVGRRLCPQLSTQIVTALGNEVESRLKANMPYNHEGTAKRRWQAILANEVNLETYRAVVIPVKAGGSAIRYGEFASNWELRDGQLSNKGNVNQPTDARLAKVATAGCALAFPLFSPASGRRWANAVVNLNVHAFSRGHRQILHRLARGADGFKVSDSKIVRGKNGRGWYLHLTYEHPADIDYQLDRDAAAVLTVNAEGDYPFGLATVDGAKEWKRVGFGPYLKRTFQRVDNRRRDFRTTYPSAGHGRKGHGHQRAERDLRPWTQRINHLTNDVAAKTAADVVKFCVKFGCGTLVWQEPHLARRNSLWFRKNGVQWDWTLFGSRLKNQCAKAGIEIVEPERPTKAPKIQAPAAAATRNGAAHTGSMNGRSSTRGRGKGSKGSGAQRRR